MYQLRIGEINKIIIIIMESIERKGLCSDLFLVACFENKTSNN